MSNTNQFDTPVLYLIFNRPDLVKTTFSRIRDVKPRQLFIGADGPRKDHPTDAIKCEQARSIALSMIDWDCEIHTLFREENLGCGLAVSRAITWFFEHVEMGIILEDDILSDPSFFWFCRELLSYYKDNYKVMHIGGANFQNGIIRGDASYYFSNYSHVWGWATWRRAWFHYSHNIQHLVGAWKILKECKLSQLEVKYWLKVFEDVNAGKIDTWDYRWHGAIFSAAGVSIIPNVNLVENIGFGSDATHTINLKIQMFSGKIDFPLKNNRKLKICKEADYLTFRKNYKSKTTFINRLRNIAYKVIPTSIYARLKFFYYITKSWFKLRCLFK